MSHTISPNLWTDELFLPVLVQKVVQSDSPDFIWQNINIASITIGEIRKLFFDFSNAPGITGRTIIDTLVYFSPEDIAVGNVLVEENFQVVVLVDTTIDNTILAGEQYNLYCYATLDDGEVLNIIGQVLFNNSSLTLQPPTGTNFVIDIFSDDDSLNVDPHTGHVDVTINPNHSNQWNAEQNFVRIGVDDLDTGNVVVNGALQINTEPAGQQGYVLTFDNQIAVWMPPSASGDVTSVSNSDGSLIVSPTTGDVVASLNTAHSNTFTANQTFSGTTGNDTVVTITNPNNAKDPILAINRHAQPNTRGLIKFLTNSVVDWFVGFFNFGGAISAGSDLQFSSTGDGSTDPQFTMSKDGNFTIVDGSLVQPQGASNGYVMTTDADGVGSWQPGAGGGGSVTEVATDATLTGGPITTTGTLGLNLGHANHFTAKQTLDAFQLTTGTTSGFVVTADASGNGSWQALPPGGWPPSPIALTGPIDSQFTWLSQNSWSSIVTSSPLGVYLQMETLNDSSGQGVPSAKVMNLPNGGTPPWTIEVGFQINPSSQKTGGFNGGPNQPFLAAGIVTANATDTIEYGIGCENGTLGPQVSKYGAAQAGGRIDLGDYTGIVLNGDVMYLRVVGNTSNNVSFYTSSNGVYWNLMNTANLDAWTTPPWTQAGFYIRLQNSSAGFYQGAWFLHWALSASALVPPT